MEIDMKGKTLEDFTKELSGKDTLPGWYDDWEEFFRDEFRKTYYFHDATGKMYSINDREIEENTEIIRATRKSANIIEYELKWYNGGAGMNECMDEAINRLLKQEENETN